MKKTTLIFATILMSTVLASQALANPGRGEDRRFDNWGRYERQHNPGDHQGFRDGYDRDHYRVYRQSVIMRRAPVGVPHPVVVERVPVLPPPPVVDVYDSHAPGFALFLPNFSIVIR